MDQKRTGALLKQLRREKGLTQEQLGEIFFVSSRSVSRWETGSNMPDVGTLIELADFYKVDIRELLDGERKSVTTGDDAKDAMKRIAAYATEGEKKAQSKVVNTAFVLTATMFLCTILFADETPGLLYGVVPEALCDFILVIVYGIAVCMVIFYLRVRMWNEKPAPEPEKTVEATVLTKEIKTGTRETGRSVMGYSFTVTFQTADGDSVELYTYEIEYGGMKEGMKGLLTYKGRYYVDFQEYA